MSPTLSHGDEIMVDHSDSVGRLRDGIYVLRLDDVLLVKRIAMRPRRGEFSILSDNSLYPSWSNIDPALVAIVGRVVWAGRSEEHTSELPSLMRISYAVCCLKK